MGRDRRDGGGYIALWRSVREHRFWFQKQRRAATEFEAWVDLMLSATHRPSELYDRGEVIELQRGDVLTSVHTLSERWGWTRNHVRRFLDVCEKRSELTQKRTPRRTLLSLCNYSKWQGAFTTDRPTEGTTEGTTDGPIQESEESKKVKKKNPHTPKGGSFGFDDFWQAYPRKVGKGAALKAWTRLRPPLPAVLTALRWQVRSKLWTKDGGQFIPHPASYLNQTRWEDEPDVVAYPAATAPRVSPYCECGFIRSNCTTHGEAKA